MASFSVSYIFDFVVKNIGSLNNVGKAATQMAGQVTSAGAAAAGMAANLGKIAGAAGSAAAGINSVGAAAQAAQAKMAGMAAATAKAAQAQQASIGAAARIAQMRGAGYVGGPNGNGWVKGPAPESGSGGMFAGVGGRLMNMYAGVHLAKMALGMVDHTVQKGADMDTVRRKMRFQGVSEGDVAYAEQTSRALSEKHGNVSPTDMMKLMMKARTNLTGDFKHIVDEIGPLAQQASFFKAWDGGKHSGTFEKTLGEVTSAMKSGELMGHLTPEEMAKHTRALSVMKATMGDDVSVKKYLTAQMAAKSAMIGTDAEWQYGFFPSYVQSMNQRAGTAFATATQKIVGGIRLPDYSLAAMADSGLLKKSWMDAIDPTTGRQNAVLGKGGKWSFNKKTIGMDAFEGGENMGKNPQRWTIDTLLPLLEKSVPGINAKALKTAFDSGDPMAYQNALKGIDQNRLKYSLSKQFYDANAATFFEELILQAGRAMKNANLMKEVGNLDDFDGYEKAKQRIGSQWDALVTSIFGANQLATITAGLNGIASAFGALGSAIQALRNGPLGLLFPKEPGASVADPRTREGFSRVAQLWGAEQAINSQLWANGGDDRPQGLRGNQFTDAAARAAQRAAVGSPFGQFPMLTDAPDDRGFFERNVPGFYKSPSDARWDQDPVKAFPVPETVNASAVPQAITVTTDVKGTFDPAQVTVTVQGTVNGPVTGSGAAAVNATMSRGTSTSSVGGGGGGGTP